jgi:hypothetical protein
LCTPHRVFALSKSYKDLTEVLTDHDLASLGDSYVNFVYSLALSGMRGRASGAKVKGSALAEALKKAGLRKHLPSRMTKHSLADAAEALIVYGWLRNCVTLEESVTVIENAGDLIAGLAALLTVTRNKVTLL